jgi:DNA-binding response OmpR family regulator
MGISRQLKNEITDCPPTILLVARPDDRWLATWSLADAVITHPVDPAELTTAVVSLLRARAGGLPVRRPVTHAAHS